METINIIFALFGLLLFVSVMASTLSARLGLPLLLMFLFVGMLAGENGPGRIHFDNFTAAYLISQLGLAIIILDGGLRTKLDTFRLVFKPASVLATFGVIATVAILGIFITFLLDLPWYVGMLMAAIVGSTDAGAVFSLLRNSGVRLTERVQSTLEIESGANDPMAILLVTILIGFSLSPETTSFISFFTMLAQQLLLGLLCGYLFGKTLSFLLTKITLPEGLYALLIVSGGILGFAVTNMIGGSGILAVYIAGIIIGNKHTYATEHVLKVMDGLAWLAQACMFLVLGLLVVPQDLFNNLTDAILIFLFLLLVARPLAIWSGLKFFRYPRNEIAYISWVGLRGAVPVTLAILPVVSNVPDSHFIFNIVFTVVLLSLIIQGSTIAPMANLFRVTLPPKHDSIDVRDIWVGEKAVISINEFLVEKNAEVIGQSPRNLAPDNPKIHFFACVREGELMPEGAEISLQKDDLVWLKIPNENIETMAMRFSDNADEISSNLQYFGEFSIGPEAKMQDIAQLYGLPLKEEDQDLNARDIMHKHLKSPLVVGDKVFFGPFNLCIKEIKDDEVTQLSLKFPKQS